LLIVDFALPTVCVALGFWLRRRGWAVWRVVGVCTASYLVLANVMVNLVLRGYSVSIYALMLTGLTVEGLLGHPQPGNIMADPRRVFLVTVLYPMLSLCVLPTIIAWALTRLSARTHRGGTA
jgi:hypothetical protein